MFNVGDMAWYINTSWKAESAGDKFVSSGRIVSVINGTYVAAPFVVFTEKECGKLVFRTKKEAEKALIAIR